MTYEKNVAAYRDEIDRLNEEILDLLAQRIEVSLKIGEIKRRCDKPIVDKVRERAVLDNVRTLAEAKGFDSDAAERIFTLIMEICIEAEEKLE